MKTLRALLTVTVLLGGLVYAGSAASAIDTSVSAPDIAAAIARDPSVVTGASFVTAPPSGTPHAVSDVALGGFPTDGSTYGILTSGDANLADDPNSSGSSGAQDGGSAFRGDSDRDVTVLRIDLSVPAGANCLSFAFRFLSDEYPEFVNSTYNDAFIAELDSSTWTTSGSTISASENFAFDPSNNVISINAAGATSMTSDESAGTTYDGATPLLGASTPVTPGAHSLFLSIFDQGDMSYDSAVFLDDLFVGHAEEGGCVSGATTLSTSKTADSASTEVGGQNGYTITIENTSGAQATLESITDTLPAGFAYSAGSTTGATTDDPDVEGQTLTWTGPFVVPASGSITLHFGVTVSDTPGEYSNEAGGTSSDAGVTPSGPTATVTVTPASGPTPPDVGLTITGPSSGSVGGPLTYVLVATNNGPGTASDVTITYPVPAGTAFVSATSSQGSCSGTAVVVCQLGSLDEDSSASVSVTVRANQSGSIASGGSVGSSSGDENAANDGANTTTSVPEPTGQPGPPATSDTDGDGVPNVNDNCPSVANPSQNDVNANGVGDACESTPAPEAGQSANLELVSGTVLVKLPGSDEFVELGPGVQIPIGSIVNATGGKVQITTAQTGGGTQSATFFGGTFKILQQGGGAVVPARGAARAAAQTNLITVIRLTGGDFSVCGSGRTAGRIAQAEARRRRPIRRVWGSGKGTFRTGGTYSAAEVRGTIWLVSDRCDGTFTYVKRGTVVVRDFRKHKTIVLTSGQSYLAKAPKNGFH